MAKSLFSVSLQLNGMAQASQVVLAQPGTTTSALQQAVDAAVAAAGAGAILQSAVLIGGRPIDLSIAAAVSPATDGTPQSAYLVQFQSGTGPSNGLLVLSNPQTTAGVTTSAFDLAVQAAITSAGSSAIPSGISLMGMVAIDATVTG